MNIYNSRSNPTIGFHGCDENVRNDLVNNPNLVRKSQEAYDWLGNGFYIWENNYTRALQWANDKERRRTLKKPSVVGVIYSLDICLDFTDSLFINTLSAYYELLKVELEVAGKTLPKNKSLPNDKYNDLILRELYCVL